MQGISGVGAANSAQIEINSHSRRPGTPDHPGKHLGQFKNTQEQMNTDATLPLVQQQLNTLHPQQSGNNMAKADKQTGQQNDQAAQMMIMEDLRNTNNNIVDELKFTSRFNAISTAF